MPMNMKSKVLTSGPIARFAMVISLFSIIALPTAAQKKKAISPIPAEPEVFEATVKNSGETATFTDQGPADLSPVVIPGAGNVTCGQLNASTDPAFAHMTENWELKFDPPQEGTFAFVNGGGVQIGGGMSANPNLFLNIDLGASSTMNSWELLWSNSSAVNRLVSAVIVKGGNRGTNVYTYPTLASKGVGPFTTASGTQAISHISFCFEPFTGPSAAPVSVTGRAMTRAGRPVMKAVISLINVATGESKSAVTNTFGYYRFDGLEADSLYMVTVVHKQHRFANNNQTFSLTQSVEGVDFIAN